jgi:hypothetical protein
MANFAEYAAVLAKVDAKFAEIQGRHPAEFACRRGCHSCCLPGLSITELERAHIAAWLREDPLRIDQLRQLAQRDPHQGRRCAFLDDEGACAIFAVRPMLCRAHGAPTRVPRELGQPPLIDVCQLNFARGESPPLSALPPGDFLDQALLATLLSVVDRRFDAARAGQRAALTVAAILAE